MKFCRKRKHFYQVIHIMGVISFHVPVLSMEPVLRKVAVDVDQGYWLSTKQ